MEHEFQPEQIKHKYFTPWVIFISLIALAGLVFVAMRYLFGLGAVTNLTQFFPWESGLVWMLQLVLLWLLWFYDCCFRPYMASG